MKIKTITDILSIKNLIDRIFTDSSYNLSKNLKTYIRKKDRHVDHKHNEQMAYILQTFKKLLYDICTNTEEKVKDVINVNMINLLESINTDIKSFLNKKMKENSKLISMDRRCKNNISRIFINGKGWVPIKNLFIYLDDLISILNKINDLKETVIVKNKKISNKEQIQTPGSINVLNKLFDSKNIKKIILSYDMYDNGLNVIKQVINGKTL